ncbi:MAG TPA: carbamoyl-phosphate synthase subunit L, partial [Candidatus Omnitrophota bacterium]|nr:carbamoyl-phosphate synthase subunit L [Candidatus Omnitrophota bacterium]
AERIFYVADALRGGISIDRIYTITKIDRWFLYNMKEIVDLEREIANYKDTMTVEQLSKAKEFGFSDRQLAILTGSKEEDIRSLRASYKIAPDYKLVDTCAAEFKAYTPYYYSTYDK